MVHVLRCSGACRRRSGGKSANHTLRVSYYAAQRAISTGRGEWGESDSDEVEDIPRQPIEPRRSGRIRVPSQRKLENIRLSINTDEENGGESDSDEVEEIPRQPIEPRRSGRIRSPVKEHWRTFVPASTPYSVQTRSRNPMSTWCGC